MNIWFVLWFMLSLTLLGIFVWTYYTLIQQKKAWKTFAKRNKLKYKAAHPLRSATVEGKIEGFDFILASEEQITQDVAGRRFTSVMLVELGGLPMQGVIASSHMQGFVNFANLPEKIRDIHEIWNNANFIHTDRRAVMRAYLTETRIKALNSLMKLKNGMVLYVFNQEKGILRLETIDPLLDPDKIETIIKKLFRVVKVVSPRDGEYVHLEKVGERIAETPEPAFMETWDAGKETPKKNPDTEQDPDNKTADTAAEKTKPVPQKTKRKFIDSLAQNKNTEPGKAQNPFLEKLRAKAERNNELPPQDQESD